MSARRSRSRRLATRIYRDYVQAERLDAFRHLLRRAVELGYETMTLSAFAELVTYGHVTTRPRVLLLRHDIDSDVPRARRMWAIERELGVVGSYFFRRCTWDVAFMRELLAAGCEVGYHYEELATLVKERGAASTGEARSLMPPAQERLGRSLAGLRDDSGLRLDVVASHGDFANRAVGLTNDELLADRAFRREIGVELEAYDLEPHVDVRSTDGNDAAYWFPVDPLPALERGARVVEVVVHPRAWGAARGVNARIDLERLLEGALYRLRCVRRAT